MPRLGRTLLPLLALALSARAQDEEPALFHADARLVVLNASVIDKSGKLVTGLPQTAFRPFEDGVEQQIKLFKREDVPVSMGIIIDNSASMKNKRQKVERAAQDLVANSNPQDEVFVINFNDDVYRDVDFTSDPKKLAQGLARIDSMSGTAMRDAILSGVRYAKAKGKHDKKVLVVVTDGDDNMSEATLPELLREAQQREVLVYAIGLLSEEEHDAAKRAREALAEITRSTGGHVWYPSDVDDVGRIALEVARDIRSQYIVAYTPSNPKLDGSYRQIRLAVTGPNHPVARTRTGYYATADLGSKPPVPKSIIKR
ncbi:MAG: VWA domain-containing protein [Acidobacteriaceae bacterium]|jgi:VWFA-related protein